MIKVLIVDDQQLFRDLLEHMLSGYDDIQVVASATNGVDITPLVMKHLPDVILMDLDMPVCNGFEATKAIKKKLPQSKILVLTAASDEASVSEAMLSGTDGYLLKNVSKDDLVLAVRSVHAGMEVIHKDVRHLAKNASVSKLDLKNRKKVWVHDMEVLLTEREVDIIKGIVEGKETVELAQEFFIAEGRLRNIITDILSKLMLKNRTQLAVFAIKNKLV